jgi:predicted site-specific integrase-resolvase
MALLKCSKNTLYNWRRKGILPYVVMARKIYYLEEDLIKMIQRFRRIGIPGKKRRA